MLFSLKSVRAVVLFCKQYKVPTFNSLTIFSDCVKYRFISSSLKMDELSLSLMSRQLAPPLNDSRHKGQAGRIGIFGGSLEYTGAPYFAAISALKVGADLVHVFCCRDAATVIKSYSPELIVHPLLDVENAVSMIEPWLDRLHILVVGPGLGRDPTTFEVIKDIIEIGKNKQKPFVIDADGLFLISQKPEILNNFPAPGIILTPNVIEYGRIFEFESSVNVNDSHVNNMLQKWGNYVTILRKGSEDIIIDYMKKVTLVLGGSGRRCGGQGDVLAGALSVFYAWALLHKLDVCVQHDDRAMIACYAACKLTRECNSRAFQKLGRSMTASDMIQEIHSVFEEFFEIK